MTKYFEVQAINSDGESETLYGSFLRSDCKDEIDAERSSWKDQGYRKISIVAVETPDEPDPEVYPGVVTPHQLFMLQAPSFNFELDQEQLLAEALERGFVTPVEGSEDLYLVNQNYQNNG